MKVRWVAAGTLLLGISAMAFGSWFLYTAKRASDWTAVQGEVVGVHIRTYDPQGQTGLTREERDRYREYFPEVRYRWSVNGQPFQGSRYRLGEDHEPFDTEAAARDAGSRYVPGAAVTVYHDPANPASAVLDQGSSWGARVTPLLLGLLIAALGATLWIWAEPIGAAFRRGDAADLGD